MSWGEGMSMRVAPPYDMEQPPPRPKVRFTRQGNESDKSQKI